MKSVPAFDLEFCGDVLDELSSKAAQTSYGRSFLLPVFEDT